MTRMNSRHKKTPFDGKPSGGVSASDGFWSPNASLRPSGVLRQLFKVPQAGLPKIRLGRTPTNDASKDRASMGKIWREMSGRVSWNLHLMIAPSRCKFQINV